MPKGTKCPHLRGEHARCFEKLRFLFVTSNMKWMPRMTVTPFITPFKEIEMPHLNKTYGTDIAYEQIKSCKTNRNYYIYI